MARHPDHVLRNNARRGAITTWCPACKRKAALGAWAGSRTCRYCGHVEHRNGGERRKLYEQWLKEQEAEQWNHPKG